MKSENVIKIATKGYSITESQLRGDVPLNKNIEKLVTKRRKEIEKLNPIQEQLDDLDFARVVAFVRLLSLAKHQENQTTKTNNVFDIDERCQKIKCKCKHL